MQRTLAIKILIITVLTLVMLIPLTMIKSKIKERDYFQIAASNSVAESWTGSQIVMTPILVIPYTFIETKRTNTNSGWQNLDNPVKNYKIIPAERVLVEGAIHTNTLMRGIYKIPVYESELSMSAYFSKEKLEEVLLEIDKLKIAGSEITPFLSLSISDSRGIKSTPILEWNGQNIDFTPGVNIPGLSEGVHANLPQLKLDSLSEQNLEFNLKLNLKGKESLSFIPASNQVDIKINSEWPHPEFIGSFLPDKRDISEQGFSSSWQVTQFASNIGEKLKNCETAKCQSLQTLKFGVNLIDPVDIYFQSERSIKYGILFVGLSFVSFFLFENLKKIRIHPIQYGLIGLSIATFYLLLISLSEHINFGTSYLLATLSSTSLGFVYLKKVLAGTKNSLFFSLGLTLLYGILYVIIQAEDFALLMGAALVFAMLAAVMMVTRNIDWYEIGDQLTNQNKEIIKKQQELTTNQEVVD